MAKNIKADNKDSLGANQEKKKKKRSKGYSRRKGVNCEIDFMNKFKEEFGFSYCKTTRNASKLLDDCKIDLANIPLNVQIKSGYWNNRPKFELVFKEMKAHLESNFPPKTEQRNYPKVLIHKLDGHQEEHIGVTMMWSQWKEIYKGYLQWQNSQKN